MSKSLPRNLVYNELANEIVFLIKISKQNLSVLSSTKTNIEENALEVNFCFSDEY